MKRVAAIVLTTIMTIILAGWANAQVTVSIPNTSEKDGLPISIPVNVSDLTGLGVISYQFTVTFDENILDATGVSISGTLSETSGWSVIPNTNTDGQITVGGFGFTDLAGSGTLVMLNFNVVGAPLETTNLNFSSFVFNGGTPTANTSGGTFTVEGTLIDITVTSNIGSGTKVIVDGVEQNAPYVTQWYANTSHTISVATEQSGGTGIKYVYNSWAHGGTQTQTVTPATATTYTANLDTKYYLTVNSTHDSPQGEGWYSSGATANFSVTTPADESGGTRYAFTSWSGDYTGTSATASILMTGPRQVTANWKTQYYLTTSENPDAGGNISPSPPGAWYDSGTNATVDATVAAGYQWAGWSGDLSGTSKPDNILMDAPKTVTANFDQVVQITVQASPAGREFSVDGTTYTTAQTFSWIVGSQHTLSVSSPQSGGAGIRYIYSSWSDGGNQTHTYSTPAADQTVTANFTTQYYLTVTSPHDNPQGENWYNSGTTANFSVTSPADEVNGTRYIFEQWSGDYTGTSTAGSIVMDSPKEVVANWKTQYYLTVSSAHDSPQGAGWYNSGANANFSVTTPADESNGTRYRFTQWSGDHVGTTPSASILMDAPKEVMANWQTQYFLTTAENPAIGGDVSPAPPGEWYDSGSNAQVDATVATGYEWAGWSGDLSGTTKPEYLLMDAPKSVTANFGKVVQITIQTNPAGLAFSVDGTSYTTPQVFNWVENSQHTLGVDSPQGDGVSTRYLYSSWSDGGNQAHTYTVPSANETVTASFTTQYYLTVTSSHDSPQGAGWYNSGATASFSITSPADESAGIRYRFLQWSGDYSGSSTSGTITMDAPKEVIAGWIAQYYLTVTSAHDTPQGAGWYDSEVTANFSVTTPADEANNTRYAFTSWSGDYSGTQSSGSILMTAPKEVIANWKTQYKLTTAEAPAEGGDISPTPPGAWYDSGTSAEVNSTVATGYQWAGWTGDLSGTTRPDYVVMTAPKSVTANYDKIIQITIQTNPVGREYVVDGNSYTTTQTFDWIEGSQHTLTINSPQNGATGTRYLYSSWSDGGAQSHTYTVPGTNQSVTANFTTQYYLTVTSSHDSPQGQGWYNSGSSASFSVTTPADEAGGTRYAFTQWSGDYTGINPAASIIMDSPKTVVAEWKTQYYLTVTSDHDNPQGAGWYNSGATANFSVTTPADESNGTRYAFSQWSGDYSGTGSSGSISMTGPKQVIANWQTQYFLTTAENPSYGGDVTPPPPGDWYNSGEVVNLTATPANNYSWINWSGDLTGSQNPAQITMTAPKSVTGNFAGETISDPNRPDGPSSGITGQSLTYTTGGAVSSFGHDVEYMFDWGDGSQSSWGAATNSHTFTSKGSYSIRARARCQTHNEVISDWSTVRSVSITSYALTVSVSPAGAGSVNKNPNKVDYDYNETVKLTANSTNGAYQFSFWSGDVSGTDNPKNLVMNGNKSVIANYIAESVSTPGQPTGPSQGLAGESLQFSVSGATSSLGHSVEYQFDFGDGNQTIWGSRTVDYTFSNTGTFLIRARARCASHTDIISDWSTGLSITITGLKLTVHTNPDTAGIVTVKPEKDEYNYLEIVQLRAIPIDGSYEFDYWSGDIVNDNVNPRGVYMKRNRDITANFKSEEVTTPQMPVGPDKGSTEETLTFTTGNAHSTFGHSVEYQFDWGDGEMSEWGDSTQTHIYYVAGTLQVKARARCSGHNRVVSEWSVVHNINISDYTLTILIEPEGAGSVTKNPDKAKYGDGEIVELSPIGEQGYTFDRWSGDIAGNDNPVAIEMTSSKTVTAHFVETSEVVSKPSSLTGAESGIMGQLLSYTASGASSSMGNEVEYQFDWGDGSFSEWGIGVQTHVFNTSGEMEVRARARSKLNTSVVSEWTDPLNVLIEGYSITIVIDSAGTGKVNITPDKAEYAINENVQLQAEPDSGYTFEHWSGDLSGSDNPAHVIMTSNKNITAHFVETVETVSTPLPPIGLEQGIIGQQLIFSAEGASNSLGYEIEYQFVWGDGTMSSWGADERMHTYFSSDTMQVKVRARSKVHPTIISDWSEGHRIVIVGLKLKIIVEPEGSGLIAESPHKTEYADKDTVELWPVGIGGYTFDHWSGDLIGDSNPAKVVMNTHKNIYAHFVETTEKVTTPQAPSGPQKGYRGQPLHFSARGAVSNLGNNVEYQFDWGDGNKSSWGASSQSYTYLTSGSYLIRVRARSQVNLSVVSDWSETANIEITGCKLITHVNPDNSGDVNKSPAKDDYDFGAEVILSPVTNYGFVFLFWDDNVTDTTETKTVIITQDTTFTANFEFILKVEDSHPEIPKDFALHQNYPNPFNPETRINYQLAKDCQVKLTVYNISGQVVDVLVDEMQPAGSYTVSWNALDVNGNRVHSGLYLYRIETDYYAEVRKMILLK